MTPCITNGTLSKYHTGHHNTELKRESMKFDSTNTMNQTKTNTTRGVDQHPKLYLEFNISFEMEKPHRWRNG
jgi:hypothetical protein